MWRDGGGELRGTFAQVNRVPMIGSMPQQSHLMPSCLWMVGARAAAAEAAESTVVLDVVREACRVW